MKTDGSKELWAVEWPENKDKFMFKTVIKDYVQTLANITCNGPYKGTYQTDPRQFLCDTFDRKISTAIEDSDLW